jgi:hypothetical protein
MNSEGGMRKIEDAFAMRNSQPETRNPETFIPQKSYEYPDI